MNSPIGPGSTIYRFLILVIMASVIGAMVSLLAIAFIECVAWLNDILLISPRTRIQVQSPYLLTVATLLVPALGGLLVGWLLQRLSVAKRSLGPAESIRAVQLRSDLPDSRSGIVSTIAAMVSLGCGASVGQYGPMVYLGSIVGGLTAKLNFYIPNLQSIAIACGVSAAISTAFNAPIAGLIFAHEVILRHYSLQAFAPTTVAAATGYIVANIVFERPALFLVDFDGVSHGYEFGLFALLGVACAFLATGFMQLILYSARLAQITKIAPIWRPAIAGLLVGIVALSLPDVLGTGKEALRFATIEGAFENRELALLVIAKITLTALCVGFGFAGGVFSPSLLIGILFGALFWSILEVMGIPNAGVAVYAICGMMAMTSPVIGAPLTTILIVFELTRNYDLTIAAMVAVVFANLLAYRVFGRSLFDVQLAQKGIDLSFGRDRAMLESVRVIDRSTNQFTSLSSEATVENAIDNLVKDGRTEATIIDDQGRYQGMLRLQDILQCSRKSLVSTLMRGEWPQFDENTSVWLAMLTLDNFIGEAIPIVASNDDKLLGMITEANLIEAYLETVHELRREENAAV